MFTNCGKTGKDGPTTAQCRTEYTAPWTDADDVFTVTSGIQILTIPESATYYMYAYGAAGGQGENTDDLGGKGAFVTGSISVNANDKLMIIVGQEGLQSSGGGGGGGGSFVYKFTETNWYDINNALLLAAGGGGGGGKDSNGDGGDGLAGNGGGTGPSGGGSGGTNGNAGNFGVPVCRACTKIDVKKRTVRLSSSHPMSQ
eukprot:Stramenopile-MAST_4_protein_5309